MILLIIILFLIFMAVSVFFLYKFLFEKDKNKDTLSPEEKSKKTAQDFTNVKDIREFVLFSKYDNKAFVYLEIHPVSLEMMSQEEKKILTRNITAALASERKRFKMLSFPKPVDLSFLIYKYENMYKLAENEIEKRLISEEIQKMKQISVDNSASEFKFYFIFWENQDNTSELLKRARDFKNNFEGAGVKVDLISEKEIYRLCNMVNNPDYMHFDDDNYNATLPILN